MSEVDRILKKINRLNLFIIKMLRRLEQKNKVMIVEFQRVGRVVVEERMRDCFFNKYKILGRY